MQLSIYSLQRPKLFGKWWSWMTKRAVISDSSPRDHTTLLDLFSLSCSKRLFLVMPGMADSAANCTKLEKEHLTLSSGEVILSSSSFSNSLQFWGNEFLLLDYPVLRNTFSLSIGKVSGVQSMSKGSFSVTGGSYLSIELLSHLSFPRQFPGSLLQLYCLKTITPQ